MNLTRALAAGVVAVALTACGAHETGPSLSFVVENESLAPTSTLADASNECCCRVRGTVLNTSGIAVHVSLNFRARDSSAAPLGTALDFVANIPPGGRAPFEAVGISAACSRVASLDRSHNVTGVFIGPAGQ